MTDEIDIYNTDSMTHILIDHFMMFNNERNEMAKTTKLTKTATKVEKVVQKKTAAKKVGVSVGDKVAIPAGTKVTNTGTKTITKRTKETMVTVRKVETTKAGNHKIYWKSEGYIAHAIISK